MSTVKIRSLTTTATTTASDDFLVIDGTTNSTRKLSAATPAFLTSVTVPTVATAAGVNLNLATGTAASDKVLIPGTLEATAADGLAASIGTLGGASVKKALWVGGIINVAGHTTFEGVTSTGATGTGKLVYDTSPSLTTPALGTPSALLGTNITGTAAGLTAGNVTTNADLTGDVTSVGNATSIAAGVIVNADINASAAIVDTKLDTIATALKVSNSATTAASANTASAIVARDASGNFSAGTVSAALTGNASTATALATGRTIAITGDLAYTSPSFDGTGNVTAAGTLASVASAGTSGGSTAIPVVTINAKGLTTSITTAAVIAPASTLTGATLASGVTASSLTSLGTIGSLVVTAGTISGTPSASTDIANKLYVDTVAQGLDAKASCIAATTANITLSGTQTIDGISVIAADRVLVKDQTLSQNNGIYLCASGAWTRTTDADTWDELTSAFVFIETGTVNADTGWVCTANAGGTLGTTALPWSQFSGAGSYTASTGLTLTGTVFSLTAPVTVALGGTNATSAGIASFNNITGYTASGATGTTSTNLVFSTSPSLTSPTITSGILNGTLGATTPSSIAATTGTFSSTLGVTGVATLGNGAILGTPASGTVTNLTGTASININGTVGATTASTVAATTISATGLLTVSTTSTSAALLTGTNSATGLQIVNTGATASNYIIQSGGTAANALSIYNVTGAAYVAAFTSTGLNSTAIGATTPSTGAFSTLSATTSISAGSGSPPTAGIINSVGTVGFATSDNVNSSLYIRNGSGGTIIGTDTGGALRLAANGSTSAQIVAAIFSTGAAITGTLDVSGVVGIGGASNAAYGILVSSALSGTGVACYFQPTQTATGNSNTLVMTQYAGTFAKSTFTGLTTKNLFIGTPSTSGAGTIATSYQIQIAAGVAGTTTYGIYQDGTDQNYFAGTLTSNQTVSDAIGNLRLIPQNSQSAAYTLVLADSGKHILHPSADTTARTFTIPANSTVAFTIGTAVTFINQNAGGVITISITTDTMRLAGAGTTGSRTLAANGVATAVKITSTEWIISGTGLT